MTSLADHFDLIDPSRLVYMSDESIRPAAIAPHFVLTGDPARELAIGFGVGLERPELAQPPGPRQLFHVKGLEKTSNPFRWKVIQISDALGIDPDYLDAAMSFETIQSFSTSARNRASGAVGLIQFTQVAVDALRERGFMTTLGELSRMSALDQLDWVFRFLEPHAGRMHSIADVYLAIFAPAFIGESPETKIYEAPDRKYVQNATLDRPGSDGQKKGYITVADATAPVSSLYQDAQSRPPLLVTPPSPDDAIHLGTAVPLAALFGIIALRHHLGIGGNPSAFSGADTNPLSLPGGSTNDILPTFVSPDDAKRYIHETDTQWARTDADLQASPQADEVFRTSWAADLDGWRRFRDDAIQNVGWLNTKATMEQTDRWGARLIGWRKALSDRGGKLTGPGPLEPGQGAGGGGSASAGWIQLALLVAALFGVGYLVRGFKA